MRSWIRSILTMFAVGSAAVSGCKQETAAPPATPTDVVLKVPGMF
jgi:hypothetical protein